MALALEPLHPMFAASASGVDLREPLDAETVSALEAAMNRYSVLVFRDQPLSQGEQVAFSAYFGPLNKGLRRATGAPTRFDYDELIDVSNVTLDGAVATRDDGHLIGTLANQLWHSDSSFQQRPIKYSALYAVTIPPSSEGGDTEFCDLRAAYDALPEKTKREIDGLVGRHFAFHSRFMLGDHQYSPEQMSAMPAAHWPLVRTHPASHRKVLFVGSHCSEIVGMTIPESRLLVSELIEHATQREFVYRHQWRVGDLVMWDNRATLHRGRRYDLSLRRDLRRTTCEEARVSPA